MQLYLILKSKIMDLNNKLKNIPKIYYINLDERLDRKNYIESQFDELKINNWERYSASKYRIENLEDWQSLLSYKPNVNSSLKDITWTAQTITYLNLIEDWLITTTDKYAIIIEDDYNLLMFKYWHFDWEFFMNNIPYDWDIIQLSYENPFIYPCFLHPTLDSSGVGALLINRHFAEKLIRLHKIDGKYCIHKTKNKMSSIYWGNQGEPPNHIQEFLTVDYLVKIARSYSIPLMYSSVDWGKQDELNNVGADQYKCFKQCEYACKYWWTKLRDKFTLDEFFTYGKSNDHYVIFDKSKMSQGPLL
jgi:hypothetical protein